MSQPDLSAAIQRLGRAVERLEQAVGWREGGRRDLAQAHVVLQERHELLRERIEQTIARLDAMIDEAKAEEAAR